ncbi:MAG: hypothetical protein ACAH88_19040 [Roseimicrobium sp.]
MFMGATPQAEAKPVTKAKFSAGPVLQRGQADKLSLTEADKAILNFIDGFTNRTYIVGGSVAGKTASSIYRCTQLIASIKDLEEFQERLTEKGSPMGNGMAIGNKICFNYLDTTFEVEFLIDETFQKRVQAIQAGMRASGEPIVFAHEALLYDPEQKQLSDPYKAVHGRTALLKRVRYTDSYEDLFQASLETACFNLLPSARDQADLNALLARKVATKTQAGTIAKAFVQSLSLASQVSTQSSIAKFFSSNLVRSALQAEFGIDGLRVQQNFARIRSRLPATITDGTVWHAICKGAENTTNGVYRVPAAALAGSSQLKTFLTMQEYQNVGTVTGDKGFRVYV